jgi:hypothetical protein
MYPNQKNAESSSRGWIDFARDLSEHLETAFSSGKPSVGIQIEIQKGHGLRWTGEQMQEYTIDFQRQVQMSHVTGFIR